MSIRRVLLATDAVGGVWTYSIELARSLRAIGVEAIVAAMGPSPGAAQIEAAEGIRVIDTGLPLDWLANRPQKIRAAGIALAHMATAERVDVVQLPNAAFACDVGFDQPVVAVQHSCVATWWEAVRNSRLPDDFAWRRDLVECGLNCVDAIVAPTAAFAAQTARIYGLSKAVYAVHNGRRPIALPQRKRAHFVLTIGRLWDEGKNVRTLDQAAALIDAPIEAVGALHGPNGAQVRLDNLRAPGSLTERAIAERLAARPVFASSALYEPFGLSALEAAQAGCALVLADISTFRELWEGAAVFVDAGDARGFAGVFHELLRNADKRDELGRAAHLRALRYTADAMAQRMLRIYEQVTAREIRAVPLAVAGAA